MSLLQSSSGKTISMDDVLRQQAELEEEAAEAIPYTFTTCTFGNASMHEAKQPLYSCLTCRPQPLDAKDRAGICAGCSVSCHGDCELVELFSRRDFVCDCGTSKIPGKQCTLTLRKHDAPSSSNKYDANFDGIFCACQTRYDPETETDEMIQCLVCEDWYHTTKCLAKGISNPESDDTVLHPEAFDTFVCEKCILGPASDSIARYAGTPGFMVLSSNGTLTSDLSSAHSAISQDKEPEKDVKDEPTALLAPVQVKTSSSVKRALPTDDEDAGLENGIDGPSEAKAQKVEHIEGREGDEVAVKGTCTAPPVRNQALLEYSLPRKDVYLDEGWRDRLCRCSECMPLYTTMPYLLQEEEVHEPPEDLDAGKSLLDLGTAALSQMPREQAVQGLEAYASMRDGLMKYLEPFARDGKVVQKSDIQRFFEEERRKKAELARGLR